MDPKKCTKSSPRGSNIQSQTSFERARLYGSDSGDNVAPAWPQLGPMLASKIDQKSILKVWAPPKAPLGPLRIDTEANLAPTWPNLDPTWLQNDPNMAPPEISFGRCPPPTWTRTPSRFPDRRHRPSGLPNKKPTMAGVGP